MSKEATNHVLSGFQPKFINQNMEIARSTHSAARLFDLGGKPTRLTLDTRPRQQMALVNQFKLDEVATKKLGRSETIVETIASPIIKRSSLTEINHYLTRLRVDEDLRETAQFYFVSARRRAPEEAKRATLLSGTHTIVAEEHLVLGLVQKAESLLLLLIPSGRRGVVILDASKVTKALEAGSENGDSSSNATRQNATTYPDDPTQDFAICYSDCLANVPPWMLAIVSGICAGCITMVGVAASTGGSDGISIPVLTAVCAGCVAAIGAVLGNCVLTCHEMFGT